MKEESLTEEQIQSIRQAFDQAIQKGPWQESSFLRAMGKRLEKVRDDFLLDVGEKSKGDREKELEIADKSTLATGEQEIYISLYSSHGNQISAWERVIANLPRQLISRPIYEEEESIRKRIKSKNTPVNEA